jgi:hypothetical protein
MRLAADDVARSVRGSWRLMTRGADALPELDLSRDGFWRSFAAFALMMPATVALLAAARLGAGLSNSSGLFDAPVLVAAVLAAQSLTILAVPMLIATLAPQQLHAPRFTSFVIAWNWAGIVSASLMAVPAAVFALGWASHSLAALQCLAFALIVLRLRYCVARAAFGSDGIAALVVLASLITDYSIVQMLSLARF